MRWAAGQGERSGQQHLALSNICLCPIILDKQEFWTMTPVLTRAAKALREIGGDDFEIEVSAGPAAMGEREKPRKTGGPGGAEEPREVGRLAVRRGAKRWTFQALEVGRLTKERAAQLLSAADFGGHKT